MPAPPPLSRSSAFSPRQTERGGFIYKISPIDGAILDILASPYDQNTIAFGANHGVVWADSTIWVAGDFGKDWLYEVDPTGAILDSIPSPTDAVGGLGGDGSLLLIGDGPDR